MDCERILSQLEAVMKYCEKVARDGQGGSGVTFGRARAALQTDLNIGSTRRRKMHIKLDDRR